MIPFIEESKLLQAMEPCNQSLSGEEKKRNTHGPMFSYTYTPDILDICQVKLFFKVGILWEHNLHSSGVAILLLAFQ